MGEKLRRGWVGDKQAGGDQRREINLGRSGGGAALRAWVGVDPEGQSSRLRRGAGARWDRPGLSHRHLVLRFWNQVLTCASVILRDLASAALSAEARYFWR